MNGANPASNRYTRGAIAFHWIIAALLVTNIALAWIADGAADADRGRILGNHKAIGLSILALSVLRILWRITHPAPPFADTLKAWEAAIAKVVHSLFYFLIIAIPVSGWAMSSAASGGKPVGFFGLFEIPGLPLSRNRERAGVFSDVHETLAFLVLLLLVLHVGAALKHQFLDRDGTLAKMIPWLR